VIFSLRRDDGDAARGRKLIRRQLTGQEVMSMTDWTPWTTGADADRWSALYEQALAWGAHPGMTAEHERLLRPLQLLALATQRLPAAALLMPALLLGDADDEGVAVRADARNLAAEVMRFTVRALQVRARDAGYLPGEWIAAGVVQAELSVLEMDACAAIVDHLEDAARSIAAAIIATENDVMAVPEHLSSALGAGLALYASINDGLSA
jgi:hypothetical protein